MNTSFFYFLFFVLTADGIMVFLTPVVVYTLTESIEYAGMSYAIWWLPRLILIPLVGKLIDSIGVRPLSIIADMVKIVGCVFLLLFEFKDPLIVSIAFGIVGSFVSIGNSQTIIAYEKIIALLSQQKEHHVNLISRMDFLGMVIGPIIGMLLIDIGYQYILFIPCLLYFSNACYFLFTKANLSIDVNESKEITRKFSNENNTNSLGFILSVPIILGTIGVAVGNNFFDGLVESAGTAIIDQAMALPVKYFGFIDVAAGVCGVLGTYIYSLISSRVSRRGLLIFGLIAIVIPSIMLVSNINSIWIFVISYSLTIIGKVITGNINRIIRIEVIPTKVLASTSSLIVLIGQLILPVTGLLLFLFGGKPYIVSYFMMLSISITLVSGCVLYAYMGHKYIKQ